MKKVAREVAGGEGKKPAKVDLKKLFRLGLVGIMAFISAIGVWPEEVKAKILSKEFENGAYSALLDIEPGDGIDDKLLFTTNSSNFFKELFYHMKVGGSIIYDDSYDNIYSPDLSFGSIIAIILPDGRQVNLFDIAKKYGSEKVIATYYPAAYKRQLELQDKTTNPGR